MNNNLENKIFKYKFKKNKLLNNIEKILSDEKKKHDEEIISDLIKIPFILKIIENFIKINLNNIKNHIILITGIYGVGKSTLINYLISLFGNANIGIKINIEKNNYDTMKNILKNHLLNLSNDNKIFFIECELKIYNDVLNLITNLEQINILNDMQIIFVKSKNFFQYKNKLINKIFYAGKNNFDDFDKLINLNIWDSLENEFCTTNNSLENEFCITNNSLVKFTSDVKIINYLITLIENFEIKKENNFYSDADFNSINNLVSKLIEFENNFIACDSKLIKQQITYFFI